MKVIPVKALEYFEHDLLRRNFSIYTIKNYLHYIRNFFLFLTAERKEKDLRGITREDVLEYWKWLENFRTYKGKPYSHGTKENSLKVLKYFFKFLKRKNLILLDPSGVLPSLKSIKRHPRCILTRKEVNRMLRKPDLKSLTGFRDRTILEVLYSTGIRNKELINLTIYDMDLESGLLRVIQGKGRKDRVVPIGKNAVNYLKEYLSEIRPKLLKKIYSKQLFINQYGKYFESNDLIKQIRRYARMSNIDKPVSPHAFRHTCATEMLRGGCSVRYVQAMLGHERIRTTQVYTKVVPVDLKRVIEKYHPREKQKNKNIVPFNCKNAKFYTLRRRKTK